MNTMESDSNLGVKRQRGNPKLGIALPYSVVREYIKIKNFKTLEEYQFWVRNERMEGRCEGFPFHPQAVYSRKNEWISKKHFLGLTEDTTPSISKPRKRKSSENDEPQQHRVGWQIIRQIFGIGKQKHFA